MYDPRKAQTQYNDYKGGTSADIADGMNLTDIAKRLKIKKGFWPVGFDFFVGETELSLEHPEVIVNVYAVDSNEYGVGIDVINQNISKKDGTLLVTGFSGEISVYEFFAFFKRFHVTGFYKGLQADRVEVVD